MLGFHSVWLRRSSWHHVWCGSTRSRSTMCWMGTWTSLWSAWAGPYLNGCLDHLTRESGRLGKIADGRAIPDVRPQPQTARHGPEAVKGRAFNSSFRAARCQADQGTAPRDPAAPSSYPRSSSSSSKHPNGAPPGVYPTTNIRRSPTHTQSGLSNCFASTLSTERRARFGVPLRLLRRRGMERCYRIAMPSMRCLNQACLAPRSILLVALRISSGDVRVVTRGTHGSTPRFRRAVVCRPGPRLLSREFRHRHLRQLRFLKQAPMPPSVGLPGILLMTTTQTTEPPDIITSRESNLCQRAAPLATSQHIQHRWSRLSHGR